MSLLRSKAVDYDLDFDQLKNSDLHIHMPAGAVAKDGPSAGCAFTLALFSLLSGRKVRSDSACTGEISLTGKVLPVGGVKEKVLAAHRAGIMRLSLPKENQRDIADLDPTVLDQMNILFVDNADELISKMIKTEASDAAKL
ncbi:unnamed protein product [Bursaphelenchus okinawaensis]|uniref:Lon proteolytic domain-containing protein n=1 Tax=Bursaphelenchus okinawaensis TaxID=465554 RepID=A0A811KR15_9BILA|nr:unnamed protein product [Bursaphelenchus okinawaensis]CAG9107519.1 unnamed protein product [Bursaphelenchus okinawaensis]